MKASEVYADKELKGLLQNAVFVGEGTSATAVPVYMDGERSTTDAPEDFIEIEYNGGYQSLTNPIGLLTGNLMVTLYCKLFSNGAVKLKRVNKLISQFDEKIDRKSSANYFYKLDLDNIITPTSANYDSGYSITSFNVQWRTK